MLAIILEGTSLYISPDTKVRLEFKSPLWDNEVIRDSYTYPFDILAVPENARAFGFANFVLTARGYKLYDASLVLHATLWLKAKLVVLRANSTVFNISVIFSPFAVDFADKLLTSFALDKIETGSLPAYAKANQTASYPAVPCQFPLIETTGFYGDANKDFEGILNRTDATGGYLTNSFNAESAKSNAYSMMPCFYLKWTLQQIFKAANYKLSGSFMEDARLDELILIGNHPSDLKTKVQYGHAILSSPVVIARGYTLNIKYDTYQENTGDVLFTGDVPNPYVAGQFYAKNCSVFRYKSQGMVKSVLRIKVRNDWHKECWVQAAPDSENAGQGKHGPTLAAGATEEFYFYYEEYQPGRLLNDNFWSHIHLFDPSDGDLGYYEPFTLLEAEWKIQNLSENNLNRYENTLLPADFLPEVSVSTYLNAIATAFCASVFLNETERLAQLVFRKDVLKAGYIDLTSYFGGDAEIEYNEQKDFELAFGWKSDVYTEFKGKTRKYVDMESQLGQPEAVDSELIVRSNKKHFVVLWDSEKDVLKWEQKGYFYPPRIVGSGTNTSEKISPAVEPALMGYSIFGKVDLPQMPDEANSSWFNLSNKSAIIRLAYYQGMQEMTLPIFNFKVRYPAASSLINIPLEYDSDAGLYPEYWKDWLRFYREHRQVSYKTKRGDLPILELIGLFTAQGGTPVRRVRLGPLNYVPKQLTMIISPNGLQETELILAY
jgi:hypothetical protein